MSTSAATRAAAATCLLLAVHTAVNARLLHRGEPVPAAGRVSVCVPARNEGNRIGPCVRSILRSRNVADLEVLVLDDRSTDATRQVVEAAAEGDTRLRLVEGKPLPDGWLGKPHACAQLATAATGDVLVFVDADVRLAPDGLATAVSLLELHDLDVVSPYPRQETSGWLGRLIQPLLQWSWLTFVPLRVAENAARPSLAVANGQLLACRAAWYRQAGGHAAACDEVIEDIALARAVVRRGGRVAVADGTDLAVCRMYDEPADLIEGYTKSLWAAFGSRGGAVGVAALLAWLYLLPPGAALSALARGEVRAALPGAAGYAAAVVGRAISARRTGGRARDAVAHPISVSALLVLLATSWWHRVHGTLTWKGRTLPVPRRRAP